MKWVVEAGSLPLKNSLFGLYAWFNLEESRQMACSVNNIEDAHRIFFDPVKNEIALAHWQHSHGLYPWIASRINDPHIRIFHEAGKDFLHRYEQALSRSRILLCDMGVNCRQILLEDCRMPLNPHSSLYFFGCVSHLIFPIRIQGSKRPAKP